jgi:hypothetical protein
MTQLVQGVPVAALVATGFVLGTHFLDFEAYAEAPASWEARPCIHRMSESSHAVGQGDVRAFIAFLQMCRS